MYELDRMTRSSKFEAGQTVECNASAGGACDGEPAYVGNRESHSSSFRARTRKMGLTAAAPSQEGIK